MNSLSMVDRMNKEDEMATKIIEVLSGQFKHGLRTNQLIKETGITDVTTLYKLLPKLRKRKVLAYAEKINYLPQFEKEMWYYHSCESGDSDLKNIVCGFALIDKGFVTKKKGSLEQFIGDYPLIDFSTQVSLTNFIKEVKDDSDYFYLIVKNENTHPIEGITVKIIVPYFFYEVGDSLKQINCKYKAHYIDVFVDCDRLFPGESSQLLLALLPTKLKVTFENEEIKEKFIKEEKVPSVIAWYRNVPIRLKGGKVTLNVLKEQTIKIEDDMEEDLTYHFA